MISLKTPKSYGLSSGGDSTLPSHPITQEEFPALMHAYTLDSFDVEDSTQQYMVDLLGYNTIRSNTLDVPGLYGFRFTDGVTAGYNIPVGDPSIVGFGRDTTYTLSSTGTGRGIGTKCGLMMLIGNNLANMLVITTRYGNVDYPPSFGIINPPTTNSCKYDASNYVTPGTPTSSGSLNALAIGLTRVGDGDAWQDAVSTGDGYTQSAAGTLVGTLSDKDFPNFNITDTPIIVPTYDSANVNAYMTGIFYFAFEGEIDRDLIGEAMAWMIDNPGKIYPGLVGVR